MAISVKRREPKSKFKSKGKSFTKDLVYTKRGRSVKRGLKGKK